ncbi:MAG: TrbC/VirB2 family protein [Chloroflexota bacterium]|nr:TrbC/VirB2 family protein [Chloroflexota bacterium]
MPGTGGRLQGAAQLGLILLLLVVVCGPAEAQTANPFADAVRIILGFFDNAVVTGIGTVAIIVVAFLCARGRMEWLTGSVVIFAIAVMIGAPQIASLIVGGG